MRSRSIAPSRATPDRLRSAGIAGVASLTVVWGLVPLILRETDLPALTFAMYRLWAGAAIYVVVLPLTRRRINLETVRRCALGGVFFCGDIVLTFAAWQLTSVASATIIGALSPVLIALAASRWFGERMGSREIMLAVLSFIGVGIVAVGSAGSAAWSPIGDLCAALSVLCWTGYWLFSKRARATTPAIEYIATVFTTAAVVITPVALVGGAVFGVSVAPPNGIEWLWVWVVAIVPGLLGHTFLAWSHRHVEAWLSALITQCMPAVAAIAAWVVLGETMPPVAILGGIVVLLATAALVVGAARAAGPRREEDVEAAVERAS